jgi:hypothetical protein
VTGGMRIVGGPNRAADFELAPTHGRN